jgi:DNA-directed RNA polymerase specialized sigma24 family protein
LGDTGSVGGATPPGAEPSDARSLVAQAIIRAVRTAPHAAFAPMPEPEREVVALARLARYSVTEIAELLEIPAAEARSRMTSGLRAVQVR